jgi:CTP:molybdopterin cytidylyltransferase MocA
MLVGDKNYFGAAFERRLAGPDVRLLRPAAAASGMLTSVHAALARPPAAAGRTRAATSAHSW